MKKNNKSDNRLIKKRLLILKMKEEGIKRVSPEAIVMLEDYLTKNLIRLLVILKEEMTARGKKTLKKEDVQEVLNKLKEDKSWEIWAVSIF